MDHHYSTENPTEPTFSPATEPIIPTQHHDTSSTRKTEYTTPLYETEISTARILTRVEGTSPNKGLSKGVVISSSIVACIGVVALVMVAVVLVRLWKTRWKRRANTRTVRSNTQLSFDNLSYVGERRRDSVYQEVDMTDFEIMRTRVVTSIKRKVSAFSASGKDKEKDTRRISCGRLSIVESKYENSTLDLGEIVQTHQV